MSNVWEREDGLRFRVLGKRVLIEMDPVPKESRTGMIVYPDGAIEHVSRTGIVRAIGPDFHGVEIGELVSFVRFQTEVHTNLQLRDKLGSEILILKPEDILLIGSVEDRERLQ